VLTADRQVTRLASTDFPVPVEAVGHVRVGKSFNPRSPQSRRDLASTLRTLDLDEHGSRGRGHRLSDDEEIDRLRAQLRAHPVHGCPDREEHVRWVERYEKLRRDTSALERRVENRTNSIARTFDRVCRLLEEEGYLTPGRPAGTSNGEAAPGEPVDGSGEVTADGRLLARLYAESDLLAAECLRSGAWDALSPPGLAAVVSALVYESRSDERVAPRVPGGPEVGEALTATIRLWGRLSEAERKHRLDFLPEPDAGFAWAAYHWAAGSPLDRVLGDSLAAGDFVRWTRQLIDFLDQIATVGGTRMRRTARRAVDGLRRGVVAYSDV
jgi:ATP-dependent RNA helicase HelY